MSWRPGPDVASSLTPPGAFYSDADVLLRHREAVFARAWHGAGGVLPQGASFAPFVLQPGFLDEPLVLTRGAAGAGCVSNVCTHRGALVTRQAGEGTTLRCPYHGRTFGLDGVFRAAPGFEEARDFPRPEESLRTVAAAHLGPIPFVSLDPAWSFDAWIAPLRERAPWFEWDGLRHDPARDGTYPVHAHWALYVENYLEGFHIPFVHPSLRAAVDLKSYHVDLLSHGTLQEAAAAEGQPAFPGGATTRDGKPLAALYFWLFPHTMFNLYPWGLSLNIVQPLAVDRTVVQFQTWVNHPEFLEQGAGSGLDAVEMEDEEVVESVAQGIKSRLYPGGRYSPRHETGTHHFHRLLTGGHG